MYKIQCVCHIITFKGLLNRYQNKVALQRTDMLDVIEYLNGYIDSSTYGIRNASILSDFDRVVDSYNQQIKKLGPNYQGDITVDVDDYAYINLIINDDRNHIVNYVNRLVNRCNQIRHFVNTGENLSIVRLQQLIHREKDGDWITYAQVCDAFGFDKSWRLKRE